MNAYPTLLDLFGASLQSKHPHGEVPDPFDVRRHGGGVGLWLAAWSWCTTGGIAMGFVFGAFIVDNSSVAWGFWMVLFLIMSVLMLNLLAPEVRRAAFRRSMAELVGISGPFSRVTRGEIKMHLDETGPYWWWQELSAGFRMCGRMIRQPGFVALALYSA
jgi:MFS family permease